jgi:putative PIN family toxin of toxin-antitoxin system
VRSSKLIIRTVTVVDREQDSDGAMYRIVLDTNVIISTLHSRRGASFAVLQRIGKAWEPLISVPLILEYEAVGKREAEKLGIAWATIDAIVTAFCFTGHETDVHFRVRPFLSDPGDEFLLELAVAGAADAIVTHNTRHFAGVDRFGVRVLTPREFLQIIEEEANEQGDCSPG